MFDTVLLVAVGCITLYDIWVNNLLLKKLENLELRLDAVERGEFKDYGKEVDADGE